MATDIEQMIEAFDEVVIKRAVNHGWMVAVLVGGTWHTMVREGSVVEALAYLHKKHAPPDA